MPGSKKEGFKQERPIKEYSFFIFTWKEGFPFFLEMGREASGAEKAARPEGWRLGVVVVFTSVSKDRSGGIVP